jgi:acyl dehydratase
MSRMLQSYAGVLENARPLLAAWARGVYRGLRPMPPERLPHHAPDVSREVGPVTLSPDRVAAYLDVTDGAALGIARTRLVPPIYYTTWSLAPFLGVLSDDALGINLLGMVHLENEVTIQRPLRLDDRVSCRVYLADLDRNERRLLLTVVAENRVGETLASESRSLILVRLPRKTGAGKDGAGSSRKPDAPARTQRPASGADATAPGAEATAPDGLDAERTAASTEQIAALEVPPWREIRTFRFSADLGRRYGLLVGDVNPIHLSRLTAQPFGFKRPIAHGFCLKAMVAHAVIREHANSDPARLERLAIRFRGAVPLPSRAVCLTRGNQFAVKPVDQSHTYAEGDFSIRD